MGIRDRLRRLEQATEGESTTLVCPECNEEFTLYGDPALEFIAYEWAKGLRGQALRPLDRPRRSQDGSARARRERVYRQGNGRVVAKGPARCREVGGRRE